jgi:hemolysin III
VRFVFRQHTLGERVADGTIHVVSVAASVVALAGLLIIGLQTHAAVMMAGLTIYGITLVAAFGCSAGYHLVTGPKLKEIMRRFDHAAIFLLIAGTYTPFILLKVNNAWGYGLLAVVWTMAAIGVVLKLFFPRVLEGLSTALYLVQGWAVLAAWEPLRAALPASVLTLLMVGGVLYTAGVVFYLWNRLPYQNAIWHGFVLSAASCHFAAVLAVAHL